jgi:4-amino-4-deoxy-L-arabinose transferase
VRAVCWFYKRCDVYLLNKGGELGYGLSYDDSKNRRLSISQFRDLVGTTSGKGNVILIMKTGKFSEYDSLIPKPSFKDMDACFGFAQF